MKELYKKFTNQSPLPENLNQALVPSRATVLKNNFGTAPGMWMEQENTVYVSLPGIPFEMKNLMKLKVLPKIIEKFDCPFIYHKTLLTIGKGESEIVKINWKYVAFLTTQNRHVRQTIGILQRAQRSGIEEIGLK